MDAVSHGAVDLFLGSWVKLVEANGMLGGNARLRNALERLCYGFRGEIDPRLLVFQALVHLLGIAEQYLLDRPIARGGVERFVLLGKNFLFIEIQVVLIALRGIGSDSNPGSCPPSA